MNNLDLILEISKEKRIPPEGISPIQLFPEKSPYVNLGGNSVFVVNHEPSEREARRRYSKNLLENLICPILLISDGGQTFEYADLIRDQRGLTFKNVFSGDFGRRVDLSQRIQYRINAVSALKAELIVKVGENARFCFKPLKH
jgi:hypothetical protein